MTKPRVRVISSPMVEVKLPDGIVVFIDPTTNSLYVRIKETADGVSTREEKPGVFVDVDEKGKLVGIYLVQPTRVTLERKLLLKRIARRYGVPGIQRLRPDYLARAAAANA